MPKCTGERPTDLSLTQRTTGSEGMLRVEEIIIEERVYHLTIQYQWSALKIYVQLMSVCIPTDRAIYT